MLESYSHFTSELLLCALGDLTMSNLVYTHIAYLNNSVEIPLFSTEISFIYCFSLLYVQGFALVRLLLFTVPFVRLLFFTISSITVLHVSPAFQELGK